MPKKMAQIMTISLFSQITDNTFPVEGVDPLEQTFNCICGNAIGIIAGGKLDE